MKTPLLTMLLAGMLGATTIQFGTAVPGNSIEGNSFGPTYVVTDPASAWHSAIGNSQWESIQANPLLPPIPDGIVYFYFSFFLPGDPVGGDLQVLVDDSAKIVLNGHTLADNIGDPQADNCAMTLPNCVTPLWRNISAELRPGANRLDVYVSQDVPNTYFGLDVYGMVVSRASQTPEPGTVLMLGGGLLVLGAWRRRTR